MYDLFHLNTTAPRLLEAIFSCLLSFDQLNTLRNFIKLGVGHQRLLEHWKVGSFRAASRKPDFAPRLVKLTADQPTLMTQLVKKGSGICRLVDDSDLLPHIVKLSADQPALVKQLVKHNSGICRLVDDPMDQSFCLTSYNCPLNILRL